MITRENGGCMTCSFENDFAHFYELRWQYTNAIFCFKNNKARLLTVADVDECFSPNISSLPSNARLNNNSASKH